MNYVKKVTKNYMPLLDVLNTKVGGLENQQNLISVGGAAGLKNYPKFKKLSVFK